MERKTHRHFFQIDTRYLIDALLMFQTRQWSSLELIASENFTSRAVMDCLGSALTNKVN